MAHPVRRTTSRLADDREIIYFDDTEPYLSGAQTRELTDKRELGPAARAGQMRRDPLSGAWIAMATHRLDRTYLPPADECPLCPTGRGTEPSEVPASDYDVVVFENRFPRYSNRNGDERGRCDGADGICGRTRLASGGARWSASRATTTRRSPTSTRAGCAR